MEGGKGFHLAKSLPAAKPLRRTEPGARGASWGRERLRGTWHRDCYREVVNIGLESGVAAARSAERQLEAITSNLANLDTPAYKRLSTGTRAFQLPGRQPTDFEIRTHANTDFGQGDLKHTSNPYHVALGGPGFFAVDGPEGELLTRNGAFRVDEKGALLSQEGHPVIWEGAHTPIDGTGEAITIDGSGIVRQGKVDVGQLRLTDYTQPEKLQKLGAGYYVATPGMEEVPCAAVVHQHTLESSNVVGIDELVAMVAIQRSFESAQSVMRLIDQSYSRLTAVR